MEESSSSLELGLEEAGKAKSNFPKTIGKGFRIVVLVVIVIVVVVTVVVQ